MHDVTVHKFAQWDDLVTADLGLVADPLIYRMGQSFLGSEQTAGTESESRWKATNQDHTSLITFLDMIVLYDRLPAFTYSDSFPDPGPLESLQTALNEYGSKVLYHIDVEHDVYRQVKASARGRLERLLTSGPFISSVAASSTLATSTAIRYAWEPTAR